MRGQTLRHAVWHPHVNAVNPPQAVRHWLTGSGSLTAKLKDHSQAFRVQRLHQRTAICLNDEAFALGLHRAGRVWEREVLLRCDNTPVVFAHTVVPMSASASDWPLFSALGERSLGATLLFGDPLVRRGLLEFARLREGHPLVLRARAALALGPEPGPEQAPPDCPPRLWYARRCLYRRRQGTLLVTEVFLPSVQNLQLQKPNKETNTQ